MTMQRKTAGLIAGAILLLMCGGVELKGSTEPGSSPGVPDVQASSAAPSAGKAQVKVTSRLWQTDHWKVFLKGGGSVDLSESAGDSCTHGSVFVRKLDTCE